MHKFPNKREVTTGEVNKWEAKFPHYSVKKYSIRSADLQYAALRKG